jgi:ankyrin repeat protein
MVVPNDSLKQKTIFVSCSSDMSAEVEVIHQVVEELNRNLPEGDRLNIFHWAKNDIVWTANGTWQEYIPRTSDPRICMVICLIGERLGSPLPDYFPFPLGEMKLPTWVRFPWTEIDTKNAVPLTGTLFELLDALNKQKESPQKKPEILVYVKADRTLFSNPSLTPDQRQYGFEQLYQKLSEGQIRIRDRNVRQDYETQLDWLDGFCENFFRSGGHPYICYGNSVDGNDATLNDLRQRVLKDISRVLNLPVTNLQTRELKNLECYQPEDHDILFGRDQTIIHLLDHLNKLSNEGTPILVLSGRSGEGKSSVLRAGLIGRLANGRYPDFGIFHTVLVDPATLGKKDPLENLEKAIDESLGNDLWRNPKSFNAIRPESRTSELAAAIKNKIQTMASDDNGRKRRIFAGIDQFEELLVAAEDDPNVSSSVSELLSSVRLLADNGLAWIVIALPSEHLERLDKYAPYLKLQTELLGRPGDADLLTIITKSFEVANVEISEGEVAEIMSDISSWLSRQEDPGPVLPLVSVMMKEIADKKYIEKQKIRAKIIPSVADLNSRIDINGVINTLCEGTWKDSEGSLKKMQQDPDTVFTRLMRQLVITGVREGKELLLLRQCPSDHPAIKIAQPLVEQMKQKRLLLQPLPGVLRLAHVSIIENWDRAAKWYVEDKENQLFIAELDLLSQKWKREKEKGLPGRLLYEPLDLDKIEDLWKSWVDDINRLPIGYMRQCLISNFNPAIRPESWKRGDDASRLSLAIITNDKELLQVYFEKIDSLEKNERLKLINWAGKNAGNTALHLAAGVGNIEAIKKFILEWGAEINIPNKTGLTPLGWACYKGHYEIVTFLLANGADANITDAWGSSPISIAFSTIIPQLEFMDESDDEKSSLNNILKREAYVKIIRDLLDRGITLNNTNCATIQEICEKALTPKTIEILDLLTAGKFSFNFFYESGETPLTTAVISDHLIQVDLLLKYGADPNLSSKSGTPLQIACHSNSEQIVNKLLAVGADLTKENDEGLAAIHYAAKNGNESIISALLQQGESCDHLSQQGISPLIAAASAGKRDIVEFLLKSGSNPNLQSETGQPAIIAAAKAGDAPILLTLLNYGAKIDSRDQRGMTALMYASWFANIDAVKILLAHHADTNILGPDNMTSRMIAESGCGISEDERKEVVILLNNGLSGW